MKIAIVGDSLSREMGRYLDADNYSIGSAWIKYIQSQIESVEFNKYDIILLMIGINDLVYFKRDIYEFMIDYIELLEMIRNKTEAIIFLQSILPTNDIDLNKKIIEINNKIRDLESNNVKFIDLWDIFIDNETKKVKKSKTLDGIHMTKSAYKEWALYLLERIKNENT